MQDLTSYYRNLCEELQQQIDLIEKKIEAKKKSKKKAKGGKKMADKDYDGDGEVETSKEEYFGSKDKAIKANMAKKKKGKKLNEGRSIFCQGIVYGGFPRVLNESGVVDQFNDGDEVIGDGESTDERIATLPDLEKQLETMETEFEQAESDLSDSDSRWSGTRMGREKKAQIIAMQEKIRQHPDTQAKIAAAEAARAAQGPGFFSQRGVKPANGIDTAAERGLNMGQQKVAPTDYWFGNTINRL